MGRMKDLFIEIYNEFDGDIPQDFNLDEYLESKSKENDEKDKQKNK